MQHIDDDMEDLFKRAAEGYPLKQEKGNWDDVVKKITPDDPVRKPRGSFFFTNKRIFFLVGAILLMISLSFIGHQVFYKNSESVRRIPSAKNQNTSNQTDLQAGKDLSAGKLSAESPSAEHTSPDVMTKFADQNKLNHRVAGKMTGRATGSEKSNNSQRIFLSHGNYEDELLPGLPEIERTYSELTFINSQVFTTPDNWYLFLENLSKRFDINTGSNISATRPAIQKPGKFYFGISAGPELSWVKNSIQNTPGIEANLVGGYRLNNRFAIETGIALNKKSYSSDGNNFKMDKMGTSMPGGMTIMNLESSADVIKIPLKLRYNFSVPQRTEWFATAGVVNYIYVNERNTYHTMYNGAAQDMKGEYKKNVYSIPAALQISLGYEKTIQRNLNLRIEPYFSRPINGMGIGSLPVSGAGIHVGLTKNLK